MLIEYRKLADIHPYHRNARKIPERAVIAVAKSINEFGWRQPIVVDKAGVIVIGHVRLAAAHWLKLDVAPVHVAANLSEEQIRALRLADNRVHDETTWDPELLTAELLDMRTLDLDLTLTGFTQREIDSMLRVTNSAEDEIPEVPEVPVTRAGDVWLCGRRRIICGDCTSPGVEQSVLVCAEFTLGAARLSGTGSRV